MSRLRLLATALFTAATLPLLLLTGAIGSAARLASIALPVAILTAGTVTWLLCRPRLRPADRLSTYVADLSPALSIAATAVALVCWTLLQFGAYAAAAYLIDGENLGAAYPLGLIAPAIGTVAASWWPSRPTRLRPQWFVGPALIVFVLDCLDHMSAIRIWSGLLGPNSWLSEAVGVLLLIAALAGTLGRLHGGGSIRRRTIAENATMAAVAVLAAWFGYDIVFAVAGHLPPAPIGATDTAITGTGGPAGQQIGVDALHQVADNVRGLMYVVCDDVGAWPMLIAAVTAAVLFGRMMTDQIDTLRRLRTGASSPAPAPSATARLLHLCAVCAGPPLVLAFGPGPAAYTAIVVGGLGPTFLLIFAAVGYARQRHLEWGPLSGIPSGTVLTLIAVTPAAALTVALPRMFAWTWSTPASWYAAVIYPATAAAAGAAGLWLRRSRPATYDKAQYSVRGPAADPYADLEDMSHPGWPVRDGHIVRVGDRIVVTLDDGRPTEAVIEAGDDQQRPVIRIGASALLAVDPAAIHVPTITAAVTA
ncbi:hypothetical protein [Hamadaea tsunoensis]|uniref:hypothetical protein n=1 Tax=Hamadaea tsunoensis TaxID=53368 RepID=UPI00040D1ACA|nr:hypothetical protein [Hamadaea tsunoensis]